MRRVLLGGLGIVFGAISGPALAQQVPGRPVDSPAITTPNTPPPTGRAAALGRPVADDAPPVAPAGLIARGQAPSGVPAATPPSTVPTGLPIPRSGTQPGASPLPPPRPVGSQPSINEVRDPTGRILPNDPLAGVGTPVPGGSFVPPVTPDGMLVQPSLDAPL